MFGAGPAVTEMVSAHGVAGGATKPLSDQMLFPKVEHPLTVQLVGSDPAAFVAAGLKAVEAGAAAINLNMACPARKIIRTGKGVGLMRDPGLAREIMVACRESLPVPVTVKIRSGWDSESINAVEMAKLAQDAHLAALIIHPRTRTQGFSGSADWSLIKTVRQEVSIPVIGNGDVRTPEDALRMFESTGCHGIWIGRAALGCPWLFAQALAATGRPQAHPAPAKGTALASVFPIQPFDVQRLADRDRAEVGRLLRFQISVATAVKREYLVVREIRKHMIWYSRGMASAHVFRTRVQEAVDFATLNALVDGYFGPER